ncbi:hypothetical protein C240_3001 [Enterococcus sp. 5H]|nr:hypothetical protein [Enterococcus sp. 5H]
MILKANPVVQRIIKQLFYFDASLFNPLIYKKKLKPAVMKADFSLKEWYSYNKNIELANL